MLSPAFALNHKLDSAETLELHLAYLVRVDPRLRPVREAAGPLALRTAARGFAGLAKVITGQQLSVASAAAIWSRFEALPGATDAAGYLRLDEAQVRAAGMSGGKCRTLRTLAEAVVAGQLDFDHLEGLEMQAAIGYLTAHKGVGPWTAEIYLMFCAAHADVFPAGDLALQKAVAHGLGLPVRPLARELAAIAAGWAPYRATAALLFWRYFAALRDRDGILL